MRIGKKGLVVTWEDIFGGHMREGATKTLGGWRQDPAASRKVRNRRRRREMAVASRRRNRR